MARSSFALVLIIGLAILFSVRQLFTISNPSRPFHWQYTSGVAQADNDSTTYLLGVGKADITGPVVEVNFMGYADSAQVGTGLRQRLYSRAFIVGNPSERDDRFVYVVLDTQSGDTAIRHGILSALKALGDEYAVYGKQNVAITGTHSHSGPGAWLNYLLPQITSKGFDKASYQAIVEGAVASIKIAHESLAPGRLSIGETEILDANINRSPFAYLANPEYERERYQHDVEKTLTMVRFSHQTASGDRDIGILTWYPVHGTSMYGNNTLVTGNNKGVAAYLFEKSTTDPSFVAGFSQAEVGDTSPNVLGAYCEYGEVAGEACDFEHSLCGNRSQPCHGRGPYWNLNDGGTASTYEIGRRQFEGSRKLWKDRPAFRPVTGTVVKSLHRYVDFSNFQFELPNGTMVRTCPAALGYSFAAGTTDGPGAFDFKQGQPGDPHANPFWAFVRNRIHTPNDTQQACHGAKTILLDVGETTSPYAWTPNIVDIQLFRVGELFMIIAPGEATTMAGRRWKAAVQLAAVNDFPDLANSDKSTTVVLGGPANTYAHYIATAEEYDVQRYEGASTLYGQHTLAAYINRTLDLLPLLDPSRSHTGPAEPEADPPINVNASLSFISPVVVDRPGFSRSFGDVIQDVEAVYAPNETVKATFVGGNPRNDFRLGGTFAAVEKFDESTREWFQFRNDQDWSLFFEWKRTSTIGGTSEVAITWETNWEVYQWSQDEPVSSHEDLMKRDDSLFGRYRLRYYGDQRAFSGKIIAFEGLSSEFQIRQ